MHAKTITFKGADVEVRELTVRQLDDLLTSTDQPMTMLDRIFNDELVTEGMLVACTGLASSELITVPPSELRPLVDAVKEVNPDFLSGMRSLEKRRG